MSDSHSAQIKHAIEKLDHFYLQGDRHDGYLSVTSNGGRIAIAIDTRHADTLYEADRFHAVDDIARQLRAHGVINVEVVNQFSPEDGNRPKLVVSMADSLESVLTLRTAHRTAIIQRAAQDLAASLHRALQLTSELGPAEAKLAMVDVLKVAGLAPSDVVKAR